MILDYCEVAHIILSENEEQTTMGFGMDTAYKMVGPVIFGMILGFYLDKTFNTSPWWMLGMIFFGIATGFWSVIKQVYYPEAYEDEKEKK